ncbi:hypothetical protein [Pseudomonas siliginis]|uniref:hypothetical protein n=1 Tax=Pseudomonas siliginis TaxID=2842346 RepID=UPI001C3E48A9|nr:hypothetical protein [Pseudomonas siliginis]MBV4472432.1 hypothetical protein [Pseudomonas siliginis]
MAMIVSNEFTALDLPPSVPAQALRLLVVTAQASTLADTLHAVDRAKVLPWGSRL